MSEKQGLSKSQRKKQRKADKRKASGSPEIESGGHLQTPSTPSKEPPIVNTQDFIESARYVNSVLGFNTPSTINNQQNNMYGYQTPQQAHFQQQGQTPDVFTSSPTCAPIPMPPPPWAIPLMEDIKAIKSTIPKIEEIESSVKNINIKITSINDKITKLENKVTDMESALNFISNEQDIQRTAINKTKDDCKGLKNVCHEIEQTLKNYKQKEEAANDKLLDLEARSMRENLMFYGIPEIPTQQGNPPENCEELVKELISTKLQIDTIPIQIDRAHRIGGDRAKKPRPIVVKFHDYTQRESIRRKSLDDATRATLRGSNMGIGIQTPQEYRDARKALMDHSKREEQLGHKARILGNKLYVNNKPVKKYIDGKVIDL